MRYEASLCAYFIKSLGMKNITVLHATTSDTREPWDLQYKYAYRTFPLMDEAYHSQAPRISCVHSCSWLPFAMHYS